MKIIFDVNEVTLMSVTLLEFENVDFLSPARLNYIPKVKYASPFMKIDTMSN